MTAQAADLNMASALDRRSPANPLVLGIDGGGSKTCAWLATNAGQVLGRGTDGDVFRDFRPYVAFCSRSIMSHAR